MCHYSQAELGALVSRNEPCGAALCDPDTEEEFSSTSVRDKGQCQGSRLTPKSRGLPAGPESSPRLALLSFPTPLNLISKTGNPPQVLALGDDYLTLSGFLHKLYHQEPTVQDTVITFCLPILLPALTQVILPTALAGKHYSYSHFTEEEGTKGQRG